MILLELDDIILTLSFVSMLIKNIIIIKLMIIILIINFIINFVFLLDLVIKSNLEYLNILKNQNKNTKIIFYLKRLIINLYINMQNIEMVNPIIIRRYHKKGDMPFNKFIISLVVVLGMGIYFHIYATNLKQLKF